MTRVNTRSGRMLATCLLSCLLPLSAADNQAENPAVGASAAAQSSTDIEQLKQSLLDQQRQINELRKELSGQKAANTSGPAAGKTFEQAPAPAPANVGTVASLTPILSPSAAAALAMPINAPVFPQKTEPKSRPASASANPCEDTPEGPSPAFIRLGSTCLVPVGFMDLTSVWRDKNAGSSMGSNFGSLPYNNTVNGNLSEFRFSPQNSRIGFRFDGDWKGTHFIGYNEFDFNGTSASNGIVVSNGAFVPRLRLFWVDARKGKVEFLAGQSWSLMTPNRNGLSALPGDLFYTQVVDINYVAGLTWTRQPGMRVLFHPSNKVTFGFSAEQADQYAGGSAGGSGITLPAAYAALSNAQLDVSQNVSAGQNVLNQPTVTPDFIAKIAFDPSSRFHFEVGGVERNFKTVNPSLLSQHFSASGGGVMVGLNGAVTKNFRLITTNYWSDGGGRYLFGQAPDLVVRANGNLSLVHSGGTIDGFEARVTPKWLLYGYYSGIYIGRDTALDANAKTLIGYGYTGSANSQNRAIQELTFGFNETIWGNPRYGAVNLMGQYEYLLRNPWFVALNAPKGTHDNTIYFNVRYTLPGATPRF